MYIIYFYFYFYTNAKGLQINTLLMNLLCKMFFFFIERGTDVSARKII